MIISHTTNVFQFELDFQFFLMFVIYKHDIRVYHDFQNNVK